MSESKVTRKFMDELCLDFPLMGTDDAHEREVYRALVFADFAARVVLPLALMQTGYLGLAQQARSLDYIDNRLRASRGARVARDVLARIYNRDGSSGRQQNALLNTARRVIDACDQAALALADLYVVSGVFRDADVDRALLDRRRANMVKAAEMTAEYAAAAVFYAIGAGVSEDELIGLATEAVADAMVVPPA